MKKTFMKCIILWTILSFVGCMYRPHYYTTHPRSIGPYIVSERVGESIDAAEREYFDLFQDIDGFVMAHLYETEPEGYLAMIQTNDDTLCIVNRDPQGLIILGEYIDRYEKIIQIREEQVKKQYIMGYKSSGEPILLKSHDEFEKKYDIIGYDKHGFAITKQEFNTCAKNRYHCSGICTFPGLITGFLVGLFGLGMAGYESSVEEEEVITVIAVSVAVGGCLAGCGALFGRGIDRNIILKLIKGSREAKVINIQKLSEIGIIQ